jgi:hypothetical protein
MSTIPPAILPVFIQTQPDRCKPLAECTREEIAAEAWSRVVESQSIFDTAATLLEYLDTGVGL